MKKVLISSFIILSIISLLFIYNIQTKKDKLDKMFHYSGFQIESSIQSFYLSNGSFPNSYKQVTAFEQELNDGKKVNWPSITDPFTGKYYKIIHVKSDIKEKNGVLIISAGLNGKIDNNVNEIPFNEFHKLKLVKKNVNEYGYQADLWEYLFSDNDMVMGYYCDEFQYLDGTVGIGKMMRFPLFENFKYYNHKRRLLKGKVEQYNLNDKSLSLSFGEYKAKFNNVINIKEITIGDTINISAEVKVSDNETFQFTQCKIYPFELTRKNIENYKDELLSEIGLSLLLPHEEKPNN